MPSKTQKQARFMAAVAHGWKPKGKKVPPLKVAKEFNKADTGTKRLSKAMKKRRRKKYQVGGLAMGARNLLQRHMGSQQPMGMAGPSRALPGKERFQGYQPPSPGIRPPITHPQLPPQMGGGMGFAPTPVGSNQPGEGDYMNRPFDPQAQQDFLSRIQMPPGMDGQLPGAGGSAMGQARDMISRFRDSMPQQGPGAGQPQIGALQQMMQRFRGAQQSQGRQAMSRPGMRPNRPYGPPGGRSGQPRRPQQLAGAQSRFNAGTMAGNRSNDLLRTSQEPSRQYNQRLNHMMGRMGGGRQAQRFAKGGSIKRAIARLHEAKSMLHDSDPDFDHIANLIKKDIPEAKGLPSMIRKAKNRKDWLAVNKKIDDTLKSLKGSE